VESDASEYLSLAQNVAAGEGFIQDGEPSSYRPPLFSVLLGGWFRLTGTSSVYSAAVFQSLEHGLGVVFAFLLFLEITDSFAGAIAASVFLAVNPLLFTRVVFVYLEPTILLFTTLAAWLSVRLIRFPGTGRAALAGAAWGLCALAKVVCWYVPLLLLLMHFLPDRYRVRWNWKQAAVLLLSFAFVIAPWTIRNYARFHRFIAVNAQGSGQLVWAVSHAEIPGERPGEEFVAELDRKSVPDTEKDAVLWKYILDHPRYFFVSRVVTNIVNFAAPARNWWVWRGTIQPHEHGWKYVGIVLLFHIPFYLFLLHRSVQWLSGTVPATIGFMLLLYWSYWAEHAILIGDPRYGLGVYPILVGLIYCPSAL